MAALVNYLWDKPEQSEIIRETIRRLTENPLGDQIDAILAEAYQVQQACLLYTSEMLPASVSPRGTACFG